MWYSRDGDRLIHDRRRQTNFTLLREPPQSRHHDVPCFCQRRERDKWQRGAALMFCLTNICRDVCFSQGFSCCGLAIFNKQRSYRADRSGRPCPRGQSAASVSQQIKKTKKGASIDTYIYSFLLLSGVEPPIHAWPRTFLHKSTWNYLLLVMKCSFTAWHRSFTAKR